MTEARLLLARNLPLINGEYKWQIIHPQRRGMPVPLADHPSNTNIISANPSVIEFMVDLVGVGGPWDGWYVSAMSMALISLR